MIIQETKRKPFTVEIEKNYYEDGFEIYVEADGYEENFESFKQISKEELQKIIDELQVLHDSIKG